MAELTPQDREKWLQRHAFECPVYRARITPQQCAANRARPEEREFTADDWRNGGNPSRAPRKPGCGDDCATFLAMCAQAPIPAHDTGKSTRGPCGYCRRATMTLPARGLCGACNTLAVKGDIAKGQDGTWRPVEPNIPPEPQAGQAPAIIVHGNRLPLTLMGADPAEQLLTGDEMERLRGADGEGEAVFESPASMPPAAASASSPPQPSGPASSSAGSGGPSGEQPGNEIPDDFLPFRAGRALVQERPLLNIRKDEVVEINGAAMRAYGLASVRYVRPLYSARRGQLGFAPTADTGADVLKLQHNGGTARISMRGTLRQFGIAARGKFPVTLGPGGMLVATIDTQAAQGGEEAA